MWPADTDQGDAPCGHCGRHASSPVLATRQSDGPQQSPPSIDTSELHTALGSLRTDLSRLLEHRGRKSYGAVKAVFLNWDECNLDPSVRDETIELQTLLRKQYNFDAGEATDIYRIPSKQPGPNLSAFISSSILEFSQHQIHGKDKLMIVYYNGHGGIDAKSRRLLISGCVLWEILTTRSLANLVLHQGDEKQEAKANHSRLEHCPTAA